jgi:hypothetical protein
MSVTDNYEIYSAGPPRETDAPMRFINVWRPDMSRKDQDEYWLTQHGPHAVEYGIPKQVRAYAQKHTRQVQPRGFDTKFQGLSAETLAHEGDLGKLAFNPKVLVANSKLTIDEQHFTQAPHGPLVFKRVDLGAVPPPSQKSGPPVREPGRTDIPRTH